MRMARLRADAADTDDVAAVVVVAVVAVVVVRIECEFSANNYRRRPQHTYMHSIRT